MSLVRLKPLAAPVFARLLGTGHPDEQTIQASETEVVRPIGLIPGMLERVTRTDEHGELAYHLSRATATTITHAPVIRRIYRNALVQRTGFATWRRNERYGKTRIGGALTRPILEFPEVRYCHSYVSWLYFGHWLTDAIPSALIDPERGEIWMPPNASWGHAPHYAGVFGLSVIEAELVIASKLIVYQDFGQGSFKRARYAILREQLHARFGGGDTVDCVYIRRGTTGVARLITNELALLEQLTLRNWKVLDVAQATVEEMQRVLCKARIVVSIDGSHLAHAHLSLLPGCTMIVLVPHDRFVTVIADYCRAHDVLIGMVVLKGSLEEGYKANLEEILRTIDLTQKTY